MISLTKNKTLLKIVSGQAIFQASEIYLIILLQTTFYKHLETRWNKIFWTNQRKHLLAIVSLSLEEATSKNLSGCQTISIQKLRRPRNLKETTSINEDKSINSISFPSLYNTNLSTSTHSSGKMKSLPIHF